MYAGSAAAAAALRLDFDALAECAHSGLRRLSNLDEFLRLQCAQSPLLLAIRL